MQTFFHCWRRKAGCFTLVMACVLMIGWLRSIVVCDVIGIPISRTMEWHVASEDQQLFWTPDPYAPSLPHWSTIPLTKAKPDPFYVFIGVYWHWRWLGFGFGQRTVDIAWDAPPLPSATAIAVPYWSLVLPLTLLSGWLLVGSRKPTGNMTRAIRAVR
jgi:hypothetical protein